MGGPRKRTGWLATLRRYSGLGAVVFVAVLVVASARAHALAVAAGDDEICSAMAFAGRSALPPSDPVDLADRHHTCCDLGACFDASALPPSPPPPATAPRRRVGVVHPPRRVAPAGRPSRRSRRPRDPPGARLRRDDGPNGPSRSGEACAAVPPGSRMRRRSSVDRIGSPVLLG